VCHLHRPVGFPRTSAYNPENIRSSPAVFAIFGG
jgi:hypothetical protein